MVSFNKTIQAGNLTRDPELRFTPDGIPVCEFGIAVNRIRSSKEDAVDFFDVSAWRELGETVANYKKKGDPILVEGRLTYSSWEAQDGSKRSKVTITAENVQFLGRANGNGNGESRPEGQEVRVGPGTQDDDEDPEIYEDIPF
jgi:single-strand DNA-binding protein